MGIRSKFKGKNTKKCNNVSWRLFWRKMPLKLLKCAQKTTCFVFSQTFYPNFLISLHRYICHICDIMQLWTYLDHIMMICDTNHIRLICDTKNIIPRSYHVDMWYQAYHNNITSCWYVITSISHQDNKLWWYVIPRISCWYVWKDDDFIRYWEGKL